MNIKSIEVCIAVTALAILGFFIHGINGFMSLFGHPNDLIATSMVSTSMQVWCQG
jgi:hypothetical protein